MDRLTRLLLDAQRGDRDALDELVVATHKDVLDRCRYQGRERTTWSVMPRVVVALVTTLVATLTMAGCGADSGPVLSPAAEAGRDVMRSSGCSSCHGANGQGGVGPTFEGLYGSEVVLDDDSTVLADDEYLRESITDPSAKIVDGYSLPMPTNDLDDAQIDQLIDFIRELGAQTP